MKNVKKRPVSKVKHLTKQEPLGLPYIQLNLSTWLKDSHGLYDYEASDAKCEKETLNINKSSHIYRQISNLRTIVIDIQDERQLPPDTVYVCTIIIDRETNCFKVQPSAITGIETPQQNAQKSYAVVRDFQKNNVEGYTLSPGNIIRLGRVEFLVLEIKNSQNTTTLHQNNELELNTEDYKVSQSFSGQCKICLVDEGTEEDPLINPCKCKGSCELIHLECLKNWINSKVKKQINGIVCSYNFSKFECEICKGAFPKTVTFPKTATFPDSKEVEMITITKPETPYLVLESLGREQKKQRILHLIHGNSGENLKVGRGHQCELRVNDISVSRLHADVRYENDTFIVKDRQSKFGTLVQFRQEIEVKTEAKLQCGRLLLEFKLKKKHSEEVDTNSDQDDLYI